jgi:uncharacterized protein YigE (DUF2233 family)
MQAKKLSGHHCGKVKYVQNLHYHICRIVGALLNHAPYHPFSALNHFALTMFNHLTRARHLHIHFYVLLFLVIFPLASCDILPSVTVSVTPAPSVSNGSQLNVWNRGATGVEVRTEDWKIQGGDDDTVTIVRFDLHKVKLSVGYQPQQPLLMNEWMQQEHAIAMMNGGYFDQQYVATALVASNGKVFGESYTGFGGMLSVDTQQNVQLRSLRQQPYDPNNEQLRQATQSSPMLMVGGKRTQFNADASQTRRSVVAMDKQGRLLFIVSPNPIFSLDQLADQLVSSDLSIETALNLDGGSSTGLYVKAGSSQVTIDSFAKLPLVIIVKAR